MLDFVRVACAVPDVRVGDPLQNARKHCAILEKADAQKVDILVLSGPVLSGFSERCRFGRTGEGFELLSAAP